MESEGQVQVRMDKEAGEGDSTGEASVVLSSEIIHVILDCLVALSVHVRWPPTH